MLLSPIKTTYVALLRAFHLDQHGYWTYLTERHAAMGAHMRS